ncbi:AAA family ATPase [Nitrosococcus wardiae]|uniref:AAA family ATPase n=1 Tax=Nitrosococcus wardiae TaxID=1814290 RepID=A0A4P7C0C8_9GAMM|nr:AAA family ATPase [Nitrosococcus wardiae]QBQ55881.1 AAA family ATPase [Nitrosococcus wardiae]
MDTLARHISEQPSMDPMEMKLAALAPRPRTVEETGLSQNLLAALIAKHLYDGGVSTLRELVARTLLAGSILETVLALMRSEAYVEIRGSVDGTTALRYGLTDRGRAFALESLMKSGYLGPAPVPLTQYIQVVQAQSVHHHQVTQAQMQSAFAEIVIGDHLLNQLGPALHSGRAIFIYGPAGTGKTYIAQRLAWMLGDPVLIPHAIAVGDTPIQLFDPIFHQPIKDPEGTPHALFEQGYDPRFILCQRPAVLTGGELTLDMLEISYEASTKVYQAPLQLKANNGIYLLDDLGRQRVAPIDLFNRWIVPMESQQDYLNLASGKRFPVPFDVILIFSTNLDPSALADEAFLRRLGYKIRFGELNAKEYAAIWRQVCEARGIEFDGEVLRYVLEELYGSSHRPLLPCHPRDLLSMALDQACYLGGSKQVTKAMLELAWQSYFVGLESDKS